MPNMQSTKFATFIEIGPVIRVYDTWRITYQGITRWHSKGIICLEVEPNPGRGGYYPRTRGCAVEERHSGLPSSLHCVSVAIPRRVGHVPQSPICLHASPRLKLTPLKMHSASPSPTVELNQDEVCVSLTPVDPEETCSSNTDFLFSEHLCDSEAQSTKEIYKGLSDLWRWILPQTVGDLVFQDISDGKENDQECGFSILRLLCSEMNVFHATDKIFLTGKPTHWDLKEPDTVFAVYTWLLLQEWSWGSSLLSFNKFLSAMLPKVLHHTACKSHYADHVFRGQYLLS